jgi:N-acetylmuramoyl-L-alanine amidase
MMRNAAVIFEFTKRIAENSSAMDLAIKPDHELVTKNLSGAINGTQPWRPTQMRGRSFGLAWGRALSLGRGRSNELRRRQPFSGAALYITSGTNSRKRRSNCDHIWAKSAAIPIKLWRSGCLRVNPLVTAGFQNRLRLVTSTLRRFRGFSMVRLCRLFAWVPGVSVLLLAGFVAGAGAEEAGARAAGAPKIEAIAARLDQHKDHARLIFETSGPVKAEAFAVSAPDRIIVDLPEVAFRIDPAVGRLNGSGKGASSGEALVKSYRFGQFAPGRSRIVIDLARPAQVTRAESVNRTEGARLEIDLAPMGPAKFVESAAEHAREATAAAAAAPKQADYSPGAAGSEPDGAVATLPLVVIDPGHGGVDVGAASKHGELEKNIVLEFAKTLRAKIEAQGRLRAMLTRGDDVFIALEDRVRFARQHGASLFISIHADTLGEASVQGATIYTVASRASDAESARIAEKENLADQAAGLDQQAASEEIGDILFDLARRETRALSRDFAGRLVGKWRDAGSLNKNPSRSAGFVVLKAHDVPSVLIELGYLSSEKDLANLTSPQWRDHAAATTAEAIDGYFAARSRDARATPQSIETPSRPQ